MEGIAPRPRRGPLAATICFQRVLSEPVGARFRCSTYEVTYEEHSPSLHIYPSVVNGIVGDALPEGYAIDPAKSHGRTPSPGLSRSERRPCRCATSIGIAPSALRRAQGVGQDGRGVSGRVAARALPADDKMRAVFAAAMFGYLPRRDLLLNIHHRSDSSNFACHGECWRWIIVDSGWW